MVALKRLLRCAAIGAVFAAASLCPTLVFADTTDDSDAKPPAAAPVTVTVDPSKIVTQNFRGLGVEWDPYAYPPKPNDWKVVEQRIDFCRPGYLRVMIRTDQYLLGFKPNSQPSFAWTDGTDKQKAFFKQLTDILDYAQARNIDVILGEWGPPNKKLVIAETDPLWASAVAAYVTYLRVTLGYTCIRYYNIINEPNGTWSGNPDFETWSTAIRNLHDAFIRTGLSRQVAIVGPDATVTTSYPDSFYYLDKSTQQLADTIGAWDIHWYATDDEVRNDQIEQTLRDKAKQLDGDGQNVAGKIRWLSESGIETGKTNGDQQLRVRTFGYGVLMSDYVAQVIRSGWDGALAWDMDDAMHIVNGQKQVDPPTDLTLKIWGFWNTQGIRMGYPEEVNPRPWFYTWSLMSRLFPKGAHIVNVNMPASEHFRATAATIDLPAGHTATTILLVNDELKSRKVTVRMAGVPDKQNLTRYDYFEDNFATDLSGLATSSGVIRHADLAAGITVQMPGRGVVVLSTYQPAGLPALPEKK